MRIMILKVVKILIVSFMLLFIKFLPLHASRLLDMTRKQLINSSDHVIVGQVVDKYSDYGKQGKYIFTYVKIKIEEDIGGNLKDIKEITIKQFGGKVGNREMVVNGGASFKTGEKTLLFLNKSKLSHFKLTGMSTGKFRVFKDDFSKALKVWNPSNPNIFNSMKYGSKPVQGGTMRMNKTVNLESFKEEIRQELNK